jgi:hypothetical protein
MSIYQPSPVDFPKRRMRENSSPVSMVARAQKYEGEVNKLKTRTVEPAAGLAGIRDDHIAIRLLGLQERLEALDRLYNEEIGNLSRELAQLKVEYVRLCQAGSAAPRGGKSLRRPALHSRQNSDESQ